MQDDAEGSRKWLELLETWRGSGKSLRAFAREREVSYWRLQYWRRKSEAAAAKPSKAKKPKPPVSKGGALKLIPLDRGLVGAAGMAGGGIVVRLGGDIAVEVKAGFDAATLAAVVATLRTAARC